MHLIIQISREKYTIRCDRGAPDGVFSDIEALPRCSMFGVRENANVKIDKLETNTPIDAYDTVTCMAIGPLSKIAIEHHLVLTCYPICGLAKLKSMI